MKKTSRAIWHSLVFVAVFAAAIAVVMLLWNYIIPPVVGWSQITYWQAAGLMVLGRLLLGGFGRFNRGLGHCHPGHQGGPGHHFRSRFHNRMREKMVNMSDEERRQFIRDHMGGFGGGCHGYGSREEQSPRQPE